MTRKITAIAAALAATGLLAVPAAGQAKTISFGIRLDHEPSNSVPAHNCREDGSEEATPVCTRVATDPGDAVAGGLTAPKSGTIIRFRVRAGAPGTMTFRLARLKPFTLDNGLGKFTGKGRGDGTGPTVHVAGNGFNDEDGGNPVESFPAHLKVQKGDYVGIDSTSTSALYCAGGGTQAIFTPKLRRSYQQGVRAGSCELLVQAVMRPNKK